MSFSFRNSLQKLLQHRPRGGDSSGFTLLEILIAMSVLVIISFGIYQATTETFKLRDVLSNEGNFYNSIRFTMSIVERDISQIYTPSLIIPPAGSNPNEQQEEKKKIEQLNAATGEGGQATPFWLPIAHSSGIRPSRFVGTDKKMTFVSASHMRIYKNSPESEFSKITYEIKADSDPDPARDGGKTAGSYLMLEKVEDPNVFETDESKTDKKALHVYPLLHGIKKMSFKYLYRKDKDRWETVNNWDSDKEEFKNKFPEIIEISFEVAGPTRLFFEGTYKFRPEVPLSGLNPSF